MMSIPKSVRRSVLAALGALVVIALVSYGWYSYTRLRDSNLALSRSLAEVEADRADLATQLADASSTILGYESQLGVISQTVGTLQKRVETDPELLKKYSKVYFLNENYVPKGIIDIDPRYTYNGKQVGFLSQAYPFLTQLLEDASSTGLHLFVESGYRSFGTQSSLKSAYTVTYGAGTANSFSADQGYSEHQLGTAVDFTTGGLKGVLSGFSHTPEYDWLEANAYKYGFALSYPADNSYYIFEPWHWRFVGIALATRLHEEREEFYTLDQRQIDPYLVALFNKN